ncbi:bifunctional ADP-dependent NAD(P)H-hydrate dehydratase/NAD(P)H-hydrate epimerase [Vibrio sp. HA2012]|uniref:NAD(P)H-hydrate dehydratase n=1 Tax=Vibrio sp. HA2012 TaxID=1971595 RepID=UPI000C2CAB91|nr:NAD(P)H-hydrate dehydratase [Vibrio sp. HA2012]PJC87475.1 bifunctional ADP-dependent NAD(P)H-hydrate dehydratase/NAD(P)H-hydrate epimerase [Vibrio sp. HA2012]
MNNQECSLYTAEDVRCGEYEIARSLSLEMYTLMERAGQAVFSCILDTFPETHSLLICCGGGNNGGDGYIVASLAKQVGMRVTLWQIGESDLTGDAAAAQAAWLALGGTISLPEDVIPPQYDIIVDALLGTGLHGQVRDSYSGLIQAINNIDIPVLAVDIPSGLCADTGVVLGCAVKAACTVSFIGLKQGLFTGQAAEYTGDIHFAGLGVDKYFSEQVPSVCSLIDAREMKGLFTPRSRTAHKGSNGRALCLGGDRGMFGAIRLASEACARAGAGLTRVVTQPENVPAIVGACPELMVYDWRGNSNEINDHLEWADIIAIGPGLGSSSWGRSLLGYSRTVEKPVVADADCLNLLVKTPDFNNKRIITPHPGEAARLLATTVEEVESDRFKAVQRLQNKYGGVVVLKGAGTLVHNGKHCWVCQAGNPGMATGGMGDVLTGIIAGLLAQGFSLAQAAKAGVWIHSTAADLCAREKGERGMLASELFPYLRPLLNS